MDDTAPPSSPPADSTPRPYVDSEGRFLGIFVGALPPEGATEVDEPPLDGRQLYDLQGKSWLPLPFDREAFAAQVTRERDRRIAAGVVFDSVIYQSRATDRENIAGAAQLALMATLRGEGQAGNFFWHGGDQPFAWIAADNSLVQMDAPMVIDFAKTAAAMKQAYTMVARAIKDMDPPPADIKDDALWQLPQ